MIELAILLIGDAERDEFRAARLSLDAAGRVTTAPDAPSAAALLAAGPLMPDLIVLAQAYPGQFPRADVDRLRRFVPLAPIVALLGSWCEGELRSGRPGPGVMRIYWHQWTVRWPRELDRLRRGRCPAWGLPPTATEDDRLLLGADEPPAACQGLIAIIAGRPDAAEWLVAACRAVGYATVWVQPPQEPRVAGAIAALFDGTDCQGPEQAELARLATRLAPLPIIVLLDFPRVSSRDRARAAGAAAVLSKPLLVQDLYWELHACTARCS